MITLRDLVKEVNHEAGGNTDARIDPIEVVNEAGYMLARMFDWDWKRKPTVELYFITGQPWIDLPRDFEDVISIRTNNEVTRVIYATSAEKIDQLRGDVTAQGHLDYYVTVTWPWQLSSTEPLPGPRMDVFPTPAEDSTTAALRLHYKAGWRKLNRMDESAAMPPDMRPLLVEFIRAVTRSRVSRTSLDQELSPIITGETMKAMIRGFGRTGGRKGGMRGGAVKLPGDTRGPAWLHQNITFE